MFKSRFFFLLIALFFLNIGYNQDRLCHLNGYIIDEAGEPLAFANVTLSDSVKIYSHSISDSLGYFSLEAPCLALYTLEASFLGYKNYSVSISLNRDKSLDPIQLLNTSFLFDEVHITDRLPAVSYNDDKVVILADSFVRASDDKMIDLLSNIPGIRITEDNEVFYMDEKVKELLVENRRFFNGDPSLGIKNIPSQSIEKIEILKKYNDIEFLKGLTSGDRLAMNVKLREGYTNFGFGEIEAGVGPENRYSIHPNYFRFSPKVAINAIGDINNTSEPPLSGGEYLRLTGSELLRKKYDLYSSIGTSISGFKPPDLIFGQNVASNIHRLLALNINTNLHRNLDIASTLLINSPESTANIITEKTTVSPSIPIDQQQLFFSENETQNIVLDLWARYKFSRKSILDARWIVKNEDNSFIGDRSLQSLSQKNTILENSKLNSDENQINLQWVHKLSNKLNGIIQLNYLNKKNDQLNVWDLFNVEGLEFLPLLTSDNAYLQQSIFPQRKKVETFIRGNYTINAKQQISTILEGSFTWIKDFTSTLQRIGQEEWSPFSDNEFNNNWEFKNYIYRASLFHFFKMKKAILRNGISLYTYNWNSLSSSFTEPYQNRIIPIIDYTFFMGHLGEVNFNYETLITIPRIEQLRQGSILDDFNTILSGSPNLQIAEDQKFSLRIKNNNPVSGRLFSLQIAAIRRNNKINNRITFLGVNPQYTVQNIETPITRYQVNSNWTKSLNKERIGKNFIIVTNNLSITNQRLSFNNLPQDVNYYRLFSQIQLRSTIGERFKYKVGYGLFSNWVKNNEASQSFQNHEVIISISHSIKDLVLIAEHSTEFQIDDNKSQSINLTNASLRYKIDNKWTATISVYNIWNNQEIRNNRITDSFFEVSSVTILPRIIMAKIRYTI